MKIIKWLDVNLEAILMVVFFSLLILLVTLQVGLRFILHTGFAWGEEIAKILFIWMSFSSFGYLTRNSRHVRIGVFREKFSEKIQKAILIFCDISFLIFAIISTKAVAVLCLNAIKYEEKLTALPWNYNVVYMAGTFGFVMMIIRTMQTIVWKLKQWDSPIEDFINYDGAFYNNNKICFETKNDSLKVNVEERTEEKT